jgi:hypothetical protein
MPEPQAVYLARARAPRPGREVTTVSVEIVERPLVSDSSYWKGQ